MGKSDLIEDETSLAYRLSNLRKDHDLSQKQLADDEVLAMVQNLAKYICDNSVSEKNSENG